MKWVEGRTLSGLLEDQRAYTHAVGHSYRSHEPIEPYLSDQWYVKVTDDRLRGSALRAMARWRAQRPGVAVPLAALIEALGQPAEAVLDVMQALEEMGAVTTSVESAHAWTFVAALLELYVGRHAGVTHVH